MHYGWQLRSLGTALGVPGSGAVSDLRLMIEGKIMEGGRDPRNVQVLLPKSTEDVSLSLRDYKGVFLTVTSDSDVERHSNPLLLNPVEDTLGELQAIQLERDALKEEVQTLLEEKAAFQERVDALTQESGS